MKKLFYKFCEGVCTSGISYVVGSLIIYLIIGWDLDFIAATFHKNFIILTPLLIFSGALNVVFTTKSEQHQKDKVH